MDKPLFLLLAGLEVGSSGRPDTCPICRRGVYNGVSRCVFPETTLKFLCVASDLTRPRSDLDSTVSTSYPEPI
jgi:hypothetical protein